MATTLVKIDTSSTYWSKAGKHQAAFDWLEANTPLCGPFHKARDIYYDLFQNGLTGSYARDFNRVFGLRLGDYSYRFGGTTVRTPGLYAAVEGKMDSIVEACAKAYGFPASN